MVKSVDFRLNVDGASRTVHFGEDVRTMNVIDVADGVERDRETGHPAFDSLDALARNLASELLGQLNPAH